MSKAQAMSLLTGIPAADVVTSPGLITPNVATGAEAAAVTETAKPVELESSRLAIFAKREAAIQRDREAFKKEREEWEKGEKAKAAAIVAKGQQFDEAFSKDKLSALKLLGYSDTDIINMLTGLGEEKEALPTLSADDARKVAQEEAQKVRDELKEKEEKGLAAQNERLIANLKTNIKDTIKAQAEKYEYCSVEEDAEQQVFEIIVDELRETKGEHLLTVDEAFSIAEEYYEALDKHRGAIKKRQATITAQATPAAKIEAARPTGAPTRPKTLTNNIAATTSGATVPANETRAEKKERLSKLLLSLNKSA